MSQAARSYRRRILRRLPVLLCLFGAVVSLPAVADGQEPPALELVGPEGQVRSVPVVHHRGYAAIAASGLRPLGWSVTPGSGGWEMRHPSGPVVTLRRASPFLEWDGRLLQMVSEPYEIGGELHVPLQLVLDFLPTRLPDTYRADDTSDIPTLRVEHATHWTEEATGMPDPETGFVGRDRAEATRRPARDLRVVVIDAGHGGSDPGAIGPTGVREKDVALSIARALARELEGVPGLEVHMTRNSDVLVPIWRRGAWATEIKGDRPGIYISIHANALQQTAARGFETYFLSEARTEHERRVAANENAPLALEDGVQPNDDLSFILKELRNFDHSHWSALLAEFIQARVSAVHPGPNRGVKQAPLAVITNALMPAVLVEAGFISNREEERALASTEFHEDVARALADAVMDFFKRFPPGESSGLERNDPGIR